MMPKFVKEMEVKKNAFEKENPEAVVTTARGEMKVKYAHSGTVGKPIVVFVHGSPGGWEAWVDFLKNPELMKEVEMYSIARPGFGSGEEKAYPSLADQIVPIQLILEKNPGKKIILVGHSYGGPVAMKAAIEEIPRIQGLILVASSISYALEEPAWYNAMADTWFIGLFLPHEFQTSNREIIKLKPELKLMEDKIDRLKTIPVHFIHGKKDELVPYAQSEELLGRIKNPLAKMITVENSGHFIPWEKSELIVQSIRDLLPSKSGAN